VSASRPSIVNVLSDLGSTVLKANDARTGLGIVESGVRLDLLLTDVGLSGGMNGRQLADMAHRRHSGPEVLFVTGYAATVAISDRLLDKGMEVTTKMDILRSPSLDDPL